MGFRDSAQDLLGFVHLIPERARERILDVAATQLPDGSAYHQYQPLDEARQRLGWIRLQRRSPVAHRGNRRVCAGDRRPVDPRRTGPVRQQPGGRRAPLRASHPVVPPRARPPRAAWTPADRQSRLERLSEPQRVLHRTRRVVPDHGDPGRRDRGVGIHRRTLRPRRRAVRRPSGSAGPFRDPRVRPPGHCCHGRDGPRSRLGRRVVPPRLRPLRRQGRIERVRRGADLHRASGHLRNGRHRRRDGPRRPGTRFSQEPPELRPRDPAAPAGVHGVPRRAGRDHAPTHPATRRTAASSATRTPG